MLISMLQLFPVPCVLAERTKTVRGRVAEAWLAARVAITHTHTDIHIQ